MIQGLGSVLGSWFHVWRDRRVCGFKLQAVRSEDFIFTGLIAARIDNLVLGGLGLLNPKPPLNPKP